MTTAIENPIRDTGELGANMRYSCLRGSKEMSRVIARLRVCFDSADNTILGLEGTDELSPGVSATAYGFFIITNDYSPAEPNGSSALLNAAVLTIDSEQDASTTYEYTVSNVTGPRVGKMTDVAENPEWEFNPAGTQIPDQNSGVSGNMGTVANSGNSGP